ncbi:MAG: MIP/aquaporin family protein [Candidatus Nitrosotenuis sp.]
MQTSRIKISDTKKRFFAEFIGTFVVVTCATGSVVANTKSGGSIGLWFEAFAPFVGVTLMVYAFGKISLAQFNPAVTIAFYITKNITRGQIPIYLAAQTTGALSGILFVKYAIGDEANLGANAPNYSYALWEIIGIEILAAVLLMAVILFVVHNKGLKGFGGIAIGGIIGMDIFFLSFISGASMNPIRALAPAILSGFFRDLWIYWTAPFIGTALIGIIYKLKFKK